MAGGMQPCSCQWLRFVRGLLLSSDGVALQLEIEAKQHSSPEDEMMTTACERTMIVTSEQSFGLALRGAHSLQRVPTNGACELSLAGQVLVPRAAGTRPKTIFEQYMTPFSF